MILHKVSIALSIVSWSNTILSVLKVFFWSKLVSLWSKTVLYIVQGPLTLHMLTLGERERERE